jgi:hypothetical protein
MIKRKKAEDDLALEEQPLENPESGPGESLEAAPEPAEEASTYKPEPTPEPAEETENKPKVPYRVFKQVAGVKWDQLAGFEHYATKNKLGPWTIPEWKAAYAQFLGRPVR